MYVTRWTFVSETLYLSQKVITKMVSFLIPSRTKSHFKPNYDGRVKVSKNQIRSPVSGGMFVLQKKFYIDSDDIFTLYFCLETKRIHSHTRIRKVSTVH